MFINAMGLILADHKRIQLGELTRPRALAAMPFGGRYRIIDFMLSNMVNSGITSVGVIALNKYRSLMDHLGTGSSWDLDRKAKGLSLLPPYINSVNVGKGGEIDDLSGLLDYFKSNKHKYVIVANSNCIMNTTLNDFVTSHEESNADVSLMYNRDGIRYDPPNTILEINRSGIIKDVMLNPPKPTSSCCGIGVAVIDRELLIDLVSESIARGDHDFSISKLLSNYQKYQFRAYEYKGIVLRVNSVSSYFACSMQLLEDRVRRELFWSGLPVFTKVKDEAPAIYNNGNQVSNCLVSDGCIVSGTISNSLLFRGVTISPTARIKNCIILQASFISEGVELENVILDKNCVIRPGVKLVGQADYPVVIGKGAIV